MEMTIYNFSFFWSLIIAGFIGFFLGLGSMFLELTQSKKDWIAFKDFQKFANKEEENMNLELLKLYISQKK